MSIGSCSRDNEKEDSLTLGSLNCLISESETLELGQPNRSTAQFDYESDSTNLTCQSAQFNISKLKGLNIASLNINSIMRHIDEIRVLLSIVPLLF